jgi:hypothetical protein
VLRGGSAQGFANRSGLPEPTEVETMSAAPVITAPRTSAIRDRLAPISMERVGGVAALLLAAGYVVILPLFATVGAPPVGAQARLEYHSTGTAVWWGIVALSVLTDLLFVPIAASLYAALRRFGQPAMLVATTFTLLFVALDLAVLWPAKVSLIGLGEQYATASPAQRDLLLAAATYPAGVVDSILTSVYSVLTLGIGILTTGLVMLRAGTARATAIIGVLTGALGIASVVETALTGSFAVLVVLASLLTIVWLVLIGWGLLRSRWAVNLGRSPARDRPHRPAA